MHAHSQNQMSEMDESFRVQRTTRWKNNTDRVQKADIVTHGHGVVRLNPNNPKAHTRALKNRIIWQPGETRELPSDLDDAIQKVVSGEIDPETGRTIGGTVLGGLCPGLTNVSLRKDQRPVLHDSLNVDLQQKIAAETRAAVAALQSSVATDAALIASHRARNMATNLANKDDEDDEDDEDGAPPIARPTQETSGRGSSRDSGGGKDAPADGGGKAPTGLRPA